MPINYFLMEIIFKIICEINFYKAKIKIIKFSFKKNQSPKL